MYNLNDQLILKVKTMSDETTVEVLEEGKKVKQLVYYDGEDVGGTVNLDLLSIFFYNLLF